MAYIKTLLDPGSNSKNTNDDSRFTQCVCVPLFKMALLLAVKPPSFTFYRFAYRGKRCCINNGIIFCITVRIYED